MRLKWFLKFDDGWWYLKCYAEPNLPFERRSRVGFDYTVSHMSTTFCRQHTYISNLPDLDDAKYIPFGSDYV